MLFKAFKLQMKPSDAGPYYNDEARCPSLDLSRSAAKLAYISKCNEYLLLLRVILHLQGEAIKNTQERRWAYEFYFMNFVS